MTLRLAVSVFVVHGLVNNNTETKYYQAKAESKMAAEFTVESSVCGYHVYQLRWTAVIGEMLTCRREPGNSSDPFAVAVIKGSEIVGHILCFFSCICNLLPRNSGSLSCSITGNHRYSSDLPQGGLELPCTYRFSGSRELIKKMKLPLDGIGRNCH